MEKTIEIPEGYEARIEGNKVILEKKKNKEAWIPKEILKYLIQKGDYRTCWATWLEKQIEQTLASGNSEKPNNHAEWSEEDENRFNNLCWVIDDSKWNEASKQGFKNFLNALRSRSHWKPSEEQMKALKEQTSWLSKDNPLHSLYYQLCEL